MMNKISRRSFLQAAGGVAAAAALTACGGKTEADKGSSQNGKIQITFYLWDRSMMKELTPWLEQKFPEYEFNFIQGFNTMDYYRDLLNRAEQLPDIITCRRFSLNDAAPLAEYLMDLSTTEVAGTFYSSYLNNIRSRTVRSAGCPCAPRWTARLQMSICLLSTISLCPPTTPSSWRPLMPLRLSALRAIRQTGDMTTPVWKPCRAVLSRS